jgi:endonuclease/exonuclease/phosphatase family metal-dependent hydrolase
VYNVHLNPSRAAIRRRQLVGLLDWLRAHAGATTRVLCGDFNATTRGSALAPVRAAGLASAHAIRHGDEPLRTFPTPLRPDIHALRPGEPLDYIFVEPATLHVRDCRLALDQPDEDDAALFPSDHAGLVADLVFAHA